MDSSVVLRALLEDSRSAISWFGERAGRVRFVASSLLPVEVYRTIRNAQLSGRAVPSPAAISSYLDEFALRSIDSTIERTAIGIDQPLRAADAIHVATALLWDVALVKIATHDAQLAVAAKALGFVVHDPVTDDPLRPPVA